MLSMLCRPEEPLPLGIIRNVSCAFRSEISRYLLGKRKGRRKTFTEIGDMKIWQSSPQNLEFAPTSESYFLAFSRDTARLQITVNSWTLYIMKFKLLFCSMFCPFSKVYVYFSQRYSLEIQDAYLQFCLCTRNTDNGSEKIKTFGLLRER